MRYNLDDQAQAASLMQHLWPKVKEALAAGKKITIEIKDASKSREQANFAATGRTLQSQWPPVLYLCH